MILRENLRHVIVSYKLSLVEVCEYPFSEGCLDSFEVYLQESGEDAVLPESVSEESVKMRMKVKSIASGLYGEDSGEFAILNSEHLRERPPSGTKEDGVELAVVLKEDSQAFWDGEDGVAMGDVFDNFAVDVFCELYRSLSSARGAYPPELAGECDKERVLASITVYPCGTVSEDSAVKVFVEGLQHLVPQASVLMLEPRLPLELKVISRVVDDLVEGRGFGVPSPIVLELLPGFFPRVTPEHTGLFGEVRLVGVLELVRSTDRDSGQASGRAVCACLGSGFTGRRAAPSGIT